MPKPFGALFNLGDQIGAAKSAISSLESERAALYEVLGELLGRVTLGAVYSEPKSGSRDPTYQWTHPDVRVEAALGFVRHYKGRHERLLAAVEKAKKVSP